MTDLTNTISSSVVHIADIDITAITLNGERVVTLSQIDTVHGRVDGTARRNFNENRERFVEGADFSRVSVDEIRTHKIMPISPKAREAVVMVTQRGYLKLVKSLNDDVAWSVFDEMIDRYFAVEKVIEAVQKLRPQAAAMLRETRLQHKMFMGILRDCGVKGNQAAISANQATKRMTGVDLMGVLGITHIDAEVNEPDLNVSSIGLRLGCSAREVNNRLTVGGFQIPGRDIKGRVYYELTDKGRKAGGVFKDTGKRHGTGVPIKQLVWSSGIIDRLRDDMARAA